MDGYIVHSGIGMVRDDLTVADAVFPVQANPAEKGVRYEPADYPNPDSVEDGQVYEYR